MRFACKRVKLEEILNCSLGLNKTAYKIFVVLMRSNSPLSIKEISKRLNLSISSVQKAIPILISKGILKRKQKNMKVGGYMYLYSIKDKEGVKSVLKNRIMLWTKDIINEIDRL